MVQSWPTMIQETLDDPVAVRLEHLHVRGADREHPLDEAGRGLLVEPVQVQRVAQRTLRPVAPMGERHVVQPRDPPALVAFSHRSPRSIRRRIGARDSRECLVGYAICQSSPSRGGPLPRGREPLPSPSAASPAGRRARNPLRRRGRRRSARPRLAGCPRARPSHEVVGKQPRGGRRLLELAARVACPHLLDQVARQAAEVADAGRGLREPGRDRPRGLQRGLLVLVDRPVGEDGDVRARAPRLRAPRSMWSTAQASASGNSPTSRITPSAISPGELQRLRPARGDEHGDAGPRREPQVGAAQA